MKWAFLFGIVFWLCVYAAYSYAGPYVTSDPTTQPVTHCGFVINSDTKVDSPVETVTGGKRCKYDLTGYPPGQLTIKATFVNLDPVWGRQESVFSSPLALVKPGTPAPPAGLVVSP